MCLKNNKQNIKVKKRGTVRLHTNGLRSDQVAEEGGKQDEHHGIENPDQVLQWDVSPQLPIKPLIG